jgi:hypothetical protein
MFFGSFADRPHKLRSIRRMMALQGAWIADPRDICQSLSHDRRGEIMKTDTTPVG